MTVGIDVAKEKHVAFFGTAAGKTLLKKLAFENNKKEFEKLIFQAEALKAQQRLKQ